MQVHGRLTTVDTPVLVHDLSRTGFAVLSQLPFPPGQTLAFRIGGPGVREFMVAASAVRTLPVRDRPGLHLSGFRFVPSDVLGVVPFAQIERLIEAVSGVESVLNAP
jgi:hypothetical protein